MSTPSIQTLITQAQQVLNLKSSNEIRATLAAVLANANVGTPLNPNLTTQQLWDEFYEIVRQPSDDIMSIIVDQMMRMVFSPPAPGGAGADKQVIFNDMGVLAGDAGLVYNKTTDKLTVAGDLTVRTTNLVVTSTGVGMGTATPSASYFLDLTTSNDARARQWIADTSFLGSGNLANGYQLRTLSGSTDGLKISNYANTVEYLRLNSSGNVVLSGGTTTANGVGVTFPAAQSVSSDANCLDDYEEGTWTMGLTFGGANVGLIAATTAGRYTKVGRLVTVSGYLSLTNKGSSTGRALITGLPFTIESSAASYQTASLRLDGISYGGAFQAFGTVNGTTIALEEISILGAVTDLINTDFTNSSAIMVSFTYTV